MTSGFCEISGAACRGIPYAIVAYLSDLTAVEIGVPDVVSLDVAFLCDALDPCVVEAADITDVVEIGIGDAVYEAVFGLGPVRVLATLDSAESAACLEKSGVFLTATERPSA